MISKIKAFFNPRARIVKLFAGTDGKIYYHVIAGNGKITNPSQGYSSASNAKRAAKSSFPDLQIIGLNEEDN